MEAGEVRRRDIPITIARTAKGELRVELAGEVVIKASPQAIARAPRDWQRPPLLAAIRRGARKLWDIESKEPSRFVLRIADRELAAWPWETALPRLAPAVRVSAVPARVLSAPLTLPLRVLVAGIDVADVASGVAQVASCALDELPSWRGTSGWPSAEILALAWGRTPADDLLTTASPDVALTLGWFERATATLQTRLVVLFPSDPSAAAGARLLASALADRGGPAVLVRRHEPSRQAHVIAAILDDRPLDSLALAGEWSLMAGQGREEGLRLAPVARRTQVFAERLARASDARMRDLGEQMLQAIPRALGERVGADQLHETVLLARRTRSKGRPLRTHGFSSKARRVEVALQDGDGEGLTVPVEPGTPCRLRVAVGPVEDLLARAAESALYEELLFPGGDEPGRWLEIGVVGLDFEVVGDPVQALWLPRKGVGLPATFIVVPGEASSARLRVCIYAEENLLQALRVELRRAPVARRPWTTSIEYALSSDARGFSGSPRRALTIGANDHDGEPVVWAKGPDIFEVRVTPDLPDRVNGARTALLRAAVSDHSWELEEKDHQYAYAEDNTGREEVLRASLSGLARAGWELCNAIFVPEVRERVVGALTGGGVLHVAHVLLEHVVPWALVYDRPYDPSRKTLNGVPVAQEVCLAPLAEGRWQQFAACGDHPDCPLHEARLETLRAEGAPVPIASTVVCPLRFWGLRNVIELPAQQAVEGNAPPPLRTSAGDPMTARVAVGMHAGLTRHNQHLTQLADVFGDPALAAAYQRDEVVDSLARDDLGLIYLFCHADGGHGSGVEPPVLRFKPPEGDEGSVADADLDGPPYRNHPLVVLNGCRTAAFRADALSPFIRKLVQDRRAAGVLGTEVAVWEYLAVEVGEQFLRTLLDDHPAGDALRGVRQRLLANKLNPLGLAYTLYASADLSL